MHILKSHRIYNKACSEKQKLFKRWWYYKVKGVFIRSLFVFIIIKYKTYNGGMNMNVWLFIYLVAQVARILILAFKLYFEIYMVLDLVFNPQGKSIPVILTEMLFHLIQVMLTTAHLNEALYTLHFTIINII